MNPATKAVSTPHPRRRFRRPRWTALLWLTAVWVLLWGDLSVANVAGGLVLAVLVHVVFPLPPIAYTGRFRPLRFLALVGRFLADLVRASVQTSVTALSVGRPLRNAVIEVPLCTRSDLYLTMVAELVSLVPGSVLVEARRTAAVLYLHILDVRGDADIDRARANVLAVERRVVRAFGSDEEIERYEADCRARAREAGRRTEGT